MKIISGLLSLISLITCVAANEPKPYLPVPSKAQLDWHDMELYSFVHFTTNTFTGKEWGFGDEDPNIFNPTEYDPEQIVGTLAKTGFKGVVLTCKHHDGFCLWPTKTTKHSVESVKWKEGKGDVVKDFAEACKKFGVKFGIYVSPWDRNHPDYGTEKYVDIYHEQLRELMTNYGPVFIVWHDGANGGDGYYGGKRGSRSINRSTYYDWPTAWGLVRELQPGAVIFSDVGPDVRWIGNERGIAHYPCWATYTPRTADGSPPAPGLTVGKDGQSGTLNGKYWIPAEADVSIRPGWFWHASQNSMVRTPENLMNLYFDSVGRGANLNLNVPPDRRGKIHENDINSLQGFRSLLDKLYEKNYADNATAKASSSRQGGEIGNIFTKGREAFWMTPDDQRSAKINIKLPKAETFNVVRLEEPIQFGQRIRQFNIKVKENGKWTDWINGSSIGPRAILRGKQITTDELLLSIDQADAAPGLCGFSLWKEAVTLTQPAISRDKKGNITITTLPAAITRYTLNGKEPSLQSPEYTSPLHLPGSGMIKAKTFLGEQASSTATMEFPASTHKWKVLSAENSASKPENAFDGNPRTLWHTHHSEKGEIPPPLNLDIDMGEQLDIAAILYTPRRDGSKNGIVSKYEIYISNSPDSWGKPVATGEFSNILANPITQKIELHRPVKGRYLRFVAKETAAASHVSVAEIGVITK